MTKKIDTFDITEYHRVRILMNEEKIINEKEYKLEDIYKAIDDLAEFSGMKKVDKYYYISKNDTPSDLGCFVWSNLEDRDWFMENVKELFWYQKDGKEIDILKFIEEKMKNEKIY